MKQRIIVAVIGIPLLLAILCVAPDWATAALLAALSVVGTHELLAAVCGPEKTRRWTALPAVMGILVVLHFYGAGHGWQLPLGIVDGLLLVGVIALPAAGVLTYGKPHAPDPAGCVRHGAGGVGHPGLLQLPAAAADAAPRRRTGAGAAGGGLLQRLGGPVYRYGLRQAQAVAAGKPPQDCGGRRGRPCRRYAGHGDLPDHLLPLYLTASAHRRLHPHGSGGRPSWASWAT